MLAQWRGVLPIPGTKTRRYLEENLAAATLKLSPQELAEIESELPETSVAGERYPETMMGSLNA